MARTLERDWEAALMTEQALRTEHERALAREPERLSRRGKGCGAALGERHSGAVAGADDDGARSARPLRV